MGKEHPVSALGDVADAMRQALKEHPANSGEAVEAVKRRLAEQAATRKGK